MCSTGLYCEIAICPLCLQTLNDNLDRFSNRNFIFYNYISICYQTAIVFHLPPPFWFWYKRKQAWKLKLNYFNLYCKFRILLVLNFSFIIVTFNIYMQYLCALIQHWLKKNDITNTMIFKLLSFYQSSIAFYIKDFIIFIGP